MTICGFKLSQILRCTASHFLLSCFAGWLGFFLTSTILSHIGSTSAMDASYIFRSSLLVALCFSLWSHLVEDYWLGRWF